jgi:CheY-like chemotaxis protein
VVRLSDVTAVSPLKSRGAFQVAVAANPSTGVSSRDYLLVAPSDTERKAWMEAVQRAMLAPSRAALVLLVVDVRSGPLPADVEVARRVRQMPLLRQPMLVLVTGLGRDEVMAAESAAEIDAVLLKPVNPSHLLDRLQTMLGSGPSAVAADGLGAEPAPTPARRVARGGPRRRAPPRRRWSAVAPQTSSARARPRRPRARPRVLRFPGGRTRSR